MRPPPERARPPATKPREVEPEERVSRGLYCLRCFGPMDGELIGEFRVAEDCPRCGFVNVLRDRGARWALAPGWLALEIALKALGVVASAALFIAMLAGGTGLGMGQGWAIGGWLMVAGLLWESAGAVTHRASSLPLAIIWRVLAGVVGLPAVALAVAEYGGLRSWAITTAVLPVLVWFAPNVLGRLHGTILRRRVRAGLGA